MTTQRHGATVSVKALLRRPFASCGPEIGRIMISLPIFARRWLLTAITSMADWHEVADIFILVISSCTASRVAGMGEL